MELAFRIGEALGRHRHLTESDAELREKIIVGQEAFDPVNLAAFGVENRDRRSPLQLKALRGGRRAGVFDVDAKGDEVPRDEFGDAGLGINLGFQPSTS